MIDEEGEIRNIYRRFVADEISADEAASQIVSIIGRIKDGAGIMFTNLAGCEISEEEQRKCTVLLGAVGKLLTEQDE